MTDRPKSSEQVQRDYAKALFTGQTTPERPDEPKNPLEGNYVPREGNNPHVRADNSDMREFVREVFDPAGH